MSLLPPGIVHVHLHYKLTKVCIQKTNKRQKQTDFWRALRLPCLKLLMLLIFTHSIILSASDIVQLLIHGR